MFSDYGCGCGCHRERKMYRMSHRRRCCSKHWMCCEERYEVKGCGCYAEPVKEMCGEPMPEPPMEMDCEE